MEGALDSVRTRIGRMMGTDPIQPDPTGEFAENRWILNIDGHPQCVDMTDGENVGGGSTWREVRLVHN